MSKTLVLLALVFNFGCSDTTFKKGIWFAGNNYIPAEQLNHGKSIYEDYCMACHGDKGDGNGVASKGLFPPPRNLKLGIYKFGHVVAGDLPHDDYFVKIMLEGLNGTAMLPWDMSKKQALAVTQYIKTFALKTWQGKDKKLGVKILPNNDPFGLARKTFAIEKGKEVYHVVAQCQTCHRAYISKQELSDLTYKINKEKMEKDDFDDDLYQIKIQESEHAYKTLPPDFTWHHIRSVNYKKETVKDLFVRLAAGVNGANMPAWKETIKDDEIWAAAYYVKSLMDLRDTPKRDRLMDSIVEKNRSFDGKAFISR